MTSDQDSLTNEKQRKIYRLVNKWGKDWNEFQRNYGKVFKKGAKGVQLTAEQILKSI